MQNQLMIDIETLSTESNAAILSIGAVFFDQKTKQTGDELHLHIAMRSSAMYGHISPETVKWWMQQSEIAREDVIKGDEIELLGALCRFEDFIHSHSEPKNLIIWAKSPSFDLVILKNSYHRFHKSIPWEFRNERDMRTFLATRENPKKPMPLIKQWEQELLQKHTALHDARQQAIKIMDAYHD